MTVKSTNRPQKGKSIISSVNDYVVIDIETTGLDPSFDSIIELAGVRVVDRIITEKFETLVNPQCTLDPFITELTGITDEMLLDAPVIEKALPAFLTFVSDSVVVGHNVNFDINFVYDSLRTICDTPFINDFIDTMRISRKLFPELPHHRLRDIVSFLGLGNRVEHRALSDVIQTQLAFESMKDYAKVSGIPLDSKYWLSSGYNVRAKDIQRTSDSIVESSIMHGKTFVVTGVLERMSRRDAYQIIINNGGCCADSVTKTVDYLVIGNNDYCPLLKDGKSRKQKRAEQFKLEGNDIEIISESVFYDMIDSDDATEVTLSGNVDTTSYEFYTRFCKELADELDHPLHYDGNVYRINPLSDGKSFAIFLFETRIALIVKQKQFRIIQIPASLFSDDDTTVFAQIKRSIIDKDTQEITDYVYVMDDGFDLDEYFMFMRKVKPKLFRSLGNENFACCNDFVTCSNAKKCLHCGDLDYNRCSYRINLENDRIFYGYNRNA